MNKKGINIIRKFDNGGNVQAEGTGYFNMLGSPVTLKHLKENPGTYFKRYRDKNGQMITKNISSTQDGNVFVHGSKEHKEYLNDKESAEVELHTDGLGYNYNTGEPTDALPSGPNKRGNEKEENTESSDPIKGTLESEGNIYNSEGDPMDLTQEIEVNPTTGTANRKEINGRIYYIEDEKLAAGIEEMGDDFLPTLYSQIDPKVLKEAGITSEEEFIEAMSSNEGVERFQTAHNTINPENTIKVDGFLGEQTLRLGMVSEETQQEDDGTGNKKTGGDTSINDTLNQIQKWGGLALTAGKAAYGIHGLGKAMKEIDIGEEPQLSAAWQAYMSKAKELAESGLPAETKAQMRGELAKANNVGVRNVLRASGGSRAAFLANAGVLNANRVSGLLKMMALDADVKQKNFKHYGESLRYGEEHMRQSKEKTRELEYKEALRNAGTWGSLGSSLIGSALEDLAYYQTKIDMAPYYQAQIDNVDTKKYQAISRGDFQSDFSVSAGSEDDEN